ncbi:hypothetical protein [Georgenia yuyongxinii]|uniref:Uncharacterized protein n=1 Tax=Georgenia yuyongxinii TaxID=2589797 RepID=A0A552WTF6_9MICO|nr:hypothetical protein [Georgenia yuyongxinii]TRW45593.1 hypothetical protein FJ693_08655 [Georgenia yuyongxinii]
MNDHDLDADGELPFEAYGQFGPGRMDLRVFDLDQVWVDIVGVPHALHEMSLEQRSNVTAHVLQYADHYRAAVARDAFTEAVVALIDGTRAPHVPDLPADPREWVESTPLMRRLRAMTPGWEAHTTDDRDQLTDEDTGRWWVTTEGSAYLVDLDARTVTRAPGQGSDGLTTGLRRDGDPVPLLAIEQCRRAHPAVLVLDVRGDGVPTIRRTSLIIRITRDTAPPADD